MFEYGYDDKALKIANFLLKNKIFIGSFSEIYQLLIAYYKKNPTMISKDEYDMIVDKYIMELELSKESYNNILSLLIKEQFRINVINKEYDQINIKYQTDLLTSCLNRPSLEMNGQDIINNYQTGVVIFMDIDNLKRTNDSYGHIYGDLLLKEFASRIKQINFSYMGRVNFYRYSGDEFLVIASFNEKETEEYINEILKSFETNYRLNKIKIHIEFSHGYVLFDKDNNKISTLISAADAKMYECKKTHKNSRR